MSTKSSLFLTENGEHWYYDFIDDSITIEVSRDSLQGDYSDKDDILLEIKKDCDLWKYLSEFRGHTFECDKVKKA